MDTTRLGTNSKLIHAGYKPDATGSVSVPIYQNSTFGFRDAAHGAALFAGAEDGGTAHPPGKSDGPRPGGKPCRVRRRPRRHRYQLRHGGQCTAYFALLEAGAHMVSTASVYGPSRAVMTRDFSRFGVRSTYVDTSDLNAVRNAIEPSTKVIYVGNSREPHDAANRHRSGGRDRARPRLPSGGR